MTTNVGLSRKHAKSENIERLFKKGGGGKKWGGGIGYRGLGSGRTAKRARGENWVTSRKKKKVRGGGGKGKQTVCKEDGCWTKARGGGAGESKEKKKKEKGGRKEKATGEKGGTTVNPGGGSTKNGRFRGKRADARMEGPLLQGGGGGTWAVKEL